MPPEEFEDPGTTDRATALVDDPAALAAVSVYIIVTFGDTALVPDSATCPIPWSITTVVALATFQERTADPLGVILVGLTEN